MVVEIATSLGVQPHLAAAQPAGESEASATHACNGAAAATRLASSSRSLPDLAALSTAQGAGPKDTEGALDSWLEWQPPSGSKPVLRTLLMIAAHQGSLEALSFLLHPSSASRGADCTAVSPSDGATALHCACEGASANCFQVITLLLEAGADKDALDHQGRKAVDLLRSAMESSQAGSSDSSSSSSSSGNDSNSSGTSSGEDSSGNDEEQCAATSSDEDGIIGDNSSEDEECPLNRPEYSTNEFRMFQFKVEDCPNMEAHDWTECPFAHPGEKARRRDPRHSKYTGVACPDFRKGSCKRGDACTFAHGVFECWLHPSRYKTQLCKDAPGCSRRVCFFAHQISELRAPEDGCPPDSDAPDPRPPLTTRHSCGPDTSGADITTAPRVHPVNRRRGHALHIGTLGALAAANGVPVGSSMLRSASLPLHTSFGSLRFGGSASGSPHGSRGSGGGSVGRTHRHRHGSRHQPSATAATAAAAAAAAAAALQHQQAQLLAAAGFDPAHAAHVAHLPLVPDALPLLAQSNGLHAAALAAAAVYASSPLAGLPLPLQPDLAAGMLPVSSPGFNAAEPFGIPPALLGMAGNVHGVAAALPHQQLFGAASLPLPPPLPISQPHHQSTLNAWHAAFDAGLHGAAAMNGHAEHRQHAHAHPLLQHHSPQHHSFSHLPGLAHQPQQRLPQQLAGPLQHLVASAAAAVAFSQPMGSQASLAHAVPVQL